ncbi:hypothetical protein KAU11_11125 [Candidatus Babeliales bacterium]|nr:hypothetical protein [Candidatus Babeliales bacterium]
MQNNARLNKVYALIVEVAQRLPGVIFTHPGITMKDAKTRIVVMHNENVQQFVIVNPFNPTDGATADDIIEHFERDDL